MVDGLLTPRACGPKGGRGPAWAVVSALAAVIAWNGPAASITLDEYFRVLNDRERGAYVTGFLDLFSNDAARDEGYRICVDETGAEALHLELMETVRSDPRMLTYDAAPWLLYTAARLCKAAGTREPSPPASAPEEPAPPAGAAALSGLDPATAGVPERATNAGEEFGTVAVLLGGGVCGVLFGIAAAVLVSRIRRRNGVSAP